ncbi:MAG TPA: DNA-3-methyladenine glycosylase 2 family protein [Mycobacteriales bacterium]|nr:DNA-3-methyladenine glycosylase 2 family protein [Mycobacteriales bacterium]
MSLSTVLGPLQRGSGDPTQRRDPAGGWWRTAQTPEGPGSLRLEVGPDRVQATAWGSGADWLVEHTPMLLGAADDPTGFEPRHPVVRETWRRRPELRLGSVRLVFELLVATVLEQRVTGSEAHRSWRELLRRFGDPAPGPAPRGMRVAPPASVWRRIPSWEWHRAGVDPARSRTVVAAAAVAPRLEEALTLPRDDRLQRLRAVPGIGVWTAAEVAQRAWGDPDAVSVGDFHLPALVGWALAGRPVDDDGMLELLAGYAGHRHRAVRLIELSGVRKPAFGPRMPVGDIRAL